MDLNIGSCNLHIIHNAFEKGLKICGLEIADLIVQLHNWFYFSSRVENFETFCEQKKYVYKKVKKHGTSQWLSLGPAVVRFSEMRNIIKEYYLTYLPTQKNFKSSKHFSNITIYLNSRGDVLQSIAALLR